MIHDQKAELNASLHKGMVHFNPLICILHPRPCIMAANLDDGESERLLQRDIGEDAVGGERQAVDVADVVLGVALGVRHRAVEVVQVDELHDLSQHLLGAARHAVYVVPVALRGAELGAF